MSAAAGAGAGAAGAAGAANEYEKRCNALDRRCDEPADFIDEGNPDAAAKFAVMQAELMQLKLEKDVLKKEKDIAVAAAAKALVAASSGSKAPDSAKKVSYTLEHPARHAAVVADATPVLAAVKKLANNQDAIWWVAIHVKALGAGDKPDWHKSYKDWVKDIKNIALAEYMGWDVDAGADEDEGAGAT